MVMVVVLGEGINAYQCGYAMNSQLRCKLKSFLMAVTANKLIRIQK